MISKLLHCCLLWVPVIGIAAPLNLENYIAEVKRANPTLEAAKLSADSQNHRISPSTTWDDPFFAVGPDQIPFDGSGGAMLRFQLSQSIPFPGKLGAKGDAAEQRFNAAKAGANATEREITVIATQTFFRAYYNQRAIELSRNLRLLLSGSVESTKSRYRTGDASHHDWLLARVELSVLEVERLRLEREAHTLRAILNELRNQPPDSAIELASMDFSEADLKEVNPDLTTQPELKAVEAYVSVADADKRYAKLSFIPDLVLQGMAMKPMGMEAMSAQKSNWGVMIGINVPLFFWRKQAELSAAAESSRNAALAEKKSLENRLNSEITDAKEQLRTAKEVVALYKKEVMPSTEMALENAKSGYATKRLPLTQFIETLKVKRTQELELLAAQIDRLLAETRIRELLSSPPTLRLAPARPTLFGSGGMTTGTMGGMNSSDTVNMGRGMSGPTRKSKEGGAISPSSGGSMPGMGGGM